MMTFSVELPGHFINRRGFVRADRQTTQRNQAFKFGIITYELDRLLSTVKNISPTGALLEVDNTLEIPEQFTLAIESEPSPRVCRVAWKKAKEIAVNFDAARREVKPDRQEQHQIRRQERRQSPRRNLDATGWIRLDGGFAIRECKIVNVSATGVQLAIPFACKIPETFMLLFSKHAQAHRVRMIWRRANQIGVKFN